jgi:hypothetical protein
MSGSFATSHAILMSRARPLKHDTAQMPLRQVMIVVRSLRLFERLDVLRETRVV